MMKRKIFVFGAVIVTGLFCVGQQAQAETPVDATRIRIDRATITKGYTVVHENALRFAITPNQVDQPVRVVLKDDTIRNTPLPSGKRAISDFYSFDMRGLESNPIIVKKPSWVALHYTTDQPQAAKALYNWDDNAQAWIRMQSYDVPEASEIRAITHLPYSRIVVLEDDSTFIGAASWLHWSKTMAAASRDFPYGTKLSVTNLENNSSITVTVYSYGPTRFDRIVDLSSDAFEKLYPLSEGTIERVKVEPYVEKPAAPNISSPAGIVINADTGKVLWDKNLNDVRSIASLTKLMTGLVFLDTGTPFNKVVTIESSDSAEGGKLYVVPGETLTTRDLFYSMLVGSANNAALALARSTGKSRAEFVARMNAKAKALGLTKTHFADPSGLDVGNTSTAAEYAILSRAALKDFTMLQGTTTKVYTFTTINTNKFHSIKSTNELLNTDLYVTGGKTGFLNESLYCLMTKIRAKNNTQYLAIVLGAPDSATRFHETEALLRWAASL